MTHSLKQIMNELPLENLPFIQQYPKLLNSWIDSQATLFEQTCLNKPNKAPHLLLLGLLTKCHIEASAAYQQVTTKNTHIQQIFEDNLGTVYANKFKNKNAQDFCLISHLWLFIQGYLKMDYSLALDHAQQIALTINPQKNQYHLEIEPIRYEFMQSFYLGEKNSPVINTGLLARIRNMIFGKN